MVTLFDYLIFCLQTGDEWRIHANNVVKTADLVASLIHYNHSLVAKLQPIIMQYLNIIEKLFVVLFICSIIINNITDFLTMLIHQLNYYHHVYVLS